MKLNLTVPFVPDAKALRDRINALLGTLASRLYSVDEKATISGTSVSTTFTKVNHTLGAIPDFIHVEPKAQAAWWVTDGDRKNWTATTVFLHFDTASVNFTGYVSRLEQ